MTAPVDRRDDQNESKNDESKNDDELDNSIAQGDEVLTYFEENRKIGCSYSTLVEIGCGVGNAIFPILFSTSTVNSQMTCPN